MVCRGLQVPGYQKLWHDLRSRDAHEARSAFEDALLLIDHGVCAAIADGSIDGEDFDCTAAAKRLSEAFKPHVHEVQELISLWTRKRRGKQWCRPLAQDLEAVLVHGCALKLRLVRSGLEHSLIWPEFREKYALTTMKGQVDDATPREVVLTLHPGLSIKFPDVTSHAILCKADVITRVRTEVTTTEQPRFMQERS